MARDVQKKLQALGYFCRFYLLNSQDMYLPQDRKRVYFCAVLASSVPHLSKDAARTMMDANMNILKGGNDVVPLDTFLLAEDDPVIANYLETCLMTDRDRAVNQHYKNLLHQKDKGHRFFVLSVSACCNVWTCFWGCKHYS